MPQYQLTVAGSAPIDLEALATQLRQKIDGLPPGSPLLAAAPVASQGGVQEFLVVVRGHEDPHIHPDGDLIINLLEGSGYMQLDEGRAYAAVGQLVVIPKAVCHAYHNEAEGDSVILATFSPLNSKAACPTVAAASDDETARRPAKDGPISKDPVD